MKKIIASFLLAIQLCSFAVTTGNAYEDAENAAAADPILQQVERENEIASKLNEDLFQEKNSSIVTGGLTAAGNFGLGMGLWKGIQGAKLGTASRKTDTQSEPKDWSLKKRKIAPWELILIAIFVGRELRETFKESKSGNPQINDGGFNNNISNMKSTNDPRTKAVITIFKVVAHLSQNIGKNISRLTGGLMAIGGALELMFITFKEMMDPREENTIGSIWKALIPQIFITTIIIGLVTSGFLWQFYIGPLFALSMKIGGVIGGKTFTLYTLPDFITKMFNAPFEVMWAGMKSMFSFKFMVNSIVPLMTILSGVFLMFITFKAICEMLQVLIDYILVGLFATVVIGFMVLGVTKNIGSGVIGAIMAAMMNVIVMFSLAGIVFNIIDTLKSDTNLSSARLLATICSLYISTVLISMIKNIGMSIHSGTNASIQASAIIDNVIDTAFQLGTFSAAVMGVNAAGSLALEKGLDPKMVASMSKEEISNFVKKNFTRGERFSAGLKALGNDMKKIGDGSAVGKFFGTYAEKAGQFGAMREQTKMLLKGEGGALENGNLFGGKASKLAPQGSAASVEDIMKGQQQIAEARKRKEEQGKGKLANNYNLEQTKNPYQSQQTDGAEYANATQQAYTESANEMSIAQGMSSLDNSGANNNNFSEEEI